MAPSTSELFSPESADDGKDFAGEKSRNNMETTKWDAVKNTANRLSEMEKMQAQAALSSKISCKGEEKNSSVKRPSNENLKVTKTQKELTDAVERLIKNTTGAFSASLSLQLRCILDKENPHRRSSSGKPSSPAMSYFSEPETDYIDQTTDWENDEEEDYLNDCVEIGSYKLTGMPSSSNDDIGLEDFLKETSIISPKKTIRRSRSQSSNSSGGIVIGLEEFLNETKVHRAPKIKKENCAPMIDLFEFLKETTTVSNDSPSRSEIRETRAQRAELSSDEKIDETTNDLFDFGIKETPPALYKSPPEFSADPTNAMNGHSSVNGYFSCLTLNRNMEEMAPIVSVGLIFKGDPLPAGYEKLTHTVGGRKADLSAGARGQYIYLIFKRDKTWPRHGALSLTVMYPDRNEYVPPGYSIIKRSGQYVNLNEGNSGERIYLMVRYGIGNPLSYIAVYQPKKEELPKGLYAILKTTSGYDADLNAGCGTPIYLAYKNHLLNMKALRSHRMSSLPSIEPSAGNLYDNIPSPAESAPVQFRRKGHRRSNERWGTYSNLKGNGSVKSEQYIDSIPSSSASSNVRRRRSQGSVLSFDSVGATTMEKPTKSIPRGAAVIFGSSHLEKTVNLAKKSLTPQLHSNINQGSNDMANLYKEPRSPPGVLNHYRSHSQRSNSVSAPSSIHSANMAAQMKFNTVTNSNSINHVGQCMNFSSQSIKQSKHLAPFKYDSFLKTRNAMHSVPTLPSLAQFTQIGSRSVPSCEAIDYTDRNKPLTPFNMPCSELIREHVEVVNMEGESVGPDCRDLLSLLLGSLYVREGDVIGKTLTELTNLVSEGDIFADDYLRADSVRSTTCLSNTFPYGHEPNRTLLDFTLEAVSDIVLQAFSKDFEPAASFFMAIVRQLKGGRSLNLCSLKRIYGAITFIACFHSSRNMVMSSTNEEKKAVAGYSGKFEFSANTVGFIEFSFLARNILIEAELECSVANGTNTPRNWPSEDNSFGIPSSNDLALERLPSVESTSRSKCRVAKLNKLFHGSSMERSNSDSLSTASSSMDEMPEEHVKDLVWGVVEGAIRMVELAKTTENTLNCVKNFGPNHSAIDIAEDDFWREASAIAYSAYPLVEGGTEGKQGVLVMLMSQCRTAIHPLRKAGNGISVWDIGRRVLSFELIRQILHGVGPNLGRDGVFGYQIRRLVVDTLLSTVNDIFKDESIFHVTIDIISVLWKNFRRHCKVELAVLMECLVLKLLKGGKGVTEAMQIQLIDKLMHWFDIHDNLVELFLNYDLDRKFVHKRRIYNELLGTICAVAERSSNLSDSIGTSLPTSAMLKDRALKAVAQMAKCLMDAAGHGHIMMKDLKTRSISYGVLGGWENESSESGSQEVKPINEKTKKLLGISNRMDGAFFDVNKNMKYVNSFKHKSELRKQAEEAIAQAFHIYETKSLKKAVKFLIKSSFIGDTPRDIANFLRIYQSDLSPESIGDYLSEYDSPGSEYHRLICRQYIRAISFHRMTLDDAIRHLLTNSGFRLPGEAQKIDRIMSVFAERYYEENCEDCPFSSPDAIFVVSFAIIMLNTDLHRTSSDNRKHKRMTKAQFINNLRRTDDLGGISEEYLGRIYDSIEVSPIAMLLEGNVIAPSKILPSFRSTLELNASERIEASFNPFLMGINKGCMQGRELLRALSLFGNRFYVLGLDTNLSQPLIVNMFETSCPHFLGAVDNILEQPTIPVESIVICLEIVKYSLSTSIFLNDDHKKDAFAQRLARIAHKMAGGHSKSPNPSINVKSNELLKQLQVKSGNAEEVIASVHQQLRALEKEVQDSYIKEELEVLSRRLGGIDISNGKRFFIKEGNLTKTCSTGFRKKYRFFLLSDKLIYAKPSMVGKQYQVHEELELCLMQVVDIEDTKEFEVRHPKKKFVAAADTVEEKKAWIKALSEALKSNYDEIKNATFVYPSPSKISKSSGSNNHRSFLIPSIKNASTRSPVFSRQGSRLAGRHAPPILSRVGSLTLPPISNSSSEELNEGESLTRSVERNRENADIWGTPAREEGPSLLSKEGHEIKVPSVASYRVYKRSPGYRTMSGLKNRLTSRKKDLQKNNSSAL